MIHPNTLTLIDVHELKKRCDANPELYLIDVREQEEWNSLHIPHAIHIPKNELASRISLLKSDLTQPIYLHCKSGVRSLQAAQTLIELGYQTIYSLEGGILAWAASGYPVQSA